MHGKVKLAPQLLLLLLFSVFITNSAEPDRDHLKNREITNIEVVSLSKFGWVSNNETTTVLKVCVTEPVGKARRLSLSSVVLTYSSISGVLINIEGNGLFSADKTCEQFEVDLETIDIKKSQTYMLNNEEWMGIATLALSIGPNELTAYTLMDFEYTCIQGPFNLEPNECQNPEEKPNICYTTEMPDEVCILAEDPGGIQVCDSTIEPSQVTDLTPVVAADLLYKTEFIEVNFTSAKINTDLRLIGTSGLSMKCMNGTCPIDSFTPGSEKSYFVGLIEFSDSVPISSRKLEIFDLDVATKTISSDTVEVTWDSRGQDTFTVSIESATEDLPYSSVTGPCHESKSKSKCKQYFIQLASGEWNSSIISTTYLRDEVIYTVSAPMSEASSINEESYEITKMTHVTHEDDSNNYDEMTTTVCIEWLPSATPSTLNKSLIIIDSSGSWLSTADSDENCFDPVTLIDGEILTDNSARVMVNIDDGESESEKYCAQVDLFLFKPSFEQVETNTARVSWRNLNGEVYYNSSSPGQDETAFTDEMTCFGSETCYYYVTNIDDGKDAAQQFWLQEVGQLTQVSVFKFSKPLAVEELSVHTPFDTRYDGKLLVCFDPVENATSYELGVQLLGDLLSSEQNATLEEHDDGKLCAVTLEAANFGSYSTLWAVVVAYGEQSSLLASGQQYYDSIYLVEDASVRAVVTESTDPDYLTVMTSWTLVDTNDGLGTYTATLINSAGDAKEEKEVEIDQQSYTFNGVGEGQYTVCVVASVDGNPSIVSEKICSNVFAVSTSEDDKVEVIEMQSQMITNDKEIKLIWTDLPEEVSSILFNWTLAKNGNFKSSKSSVQTKNLLKQMPLEDYPEGSSDYRIVPATDSSVDLPLDTETWDVCYSGIVNNRAGESTCDNIDVDTGTAPVVDPPTDVTYDSSGIITWTEPEPELDYFVEWSFGLVTKNEIVNTNEIKIDESAGPGKWLVTVQSVKDENGELYISGQSDPLHIVINGIYHSYTQTGLHEVTIYWQEMMKTGQVQAETYTVIPGKLPEVSVTCKQDDCMVVITDVNATAEEPMTVQIEKEADGNVNVPFDVYCEIISNVTKLSRSGPEGSTTTVTWDCVDGAASYNVSLFDSRDDGDFLLQYHRQTLPCSYTFDISGEDFGNDTVTVQACSSNSRCGNPHYIDLGNRPGGNNGDNVLVIVMSSLFGGLLLVVLVGFLTYHLMAKKNKKKRMELDSTNLMDNVSVISRDSSRSGGSNKNLKQEYRSGGHINPIMINSPPVTQPHLTREPTHNQPKGPSDRTDSYEAKPITQEYQSGGRNNYMMNNSPLVTQPHLTRGPSYNPPMVPADRQKRHHQGEHPEPAPGKYFRPPIQPGPNTWQRPFNQYPAGPTNRRMSLPPRRAPAPRQAPPPRGYVNRSPHYLPPSPGRERPLPRSPPVHRRRSMSPPPRRTTQDFPGPNTWMNQELKQFPRVNAADNYYMDRSRRENPPRRSNYGRRPRSSHREPYPRMSAPTRSQSYHERMV